MDLLGIRQQFVKLTGRYDLATTTTVDYDTDNGADFYINAGMKFLDQRYQTHKTQASYFDDIAADAYYMQFPNCAAIREVWCNDDEARWQLRKYSYKRMKETYAGLVSADDGGPPKFYCPIWLRAVEYTDYQNIGTFFQHVKTDDDGTYNGIMFLPKADHAYNIEVVGKFFHTELSSNTDENFWTNVAPSLLLKSAMYQLEVFWKGHKSSERWITIMDIEGREFEFNLIEQESNEARIDELE